MFHLIQSFQQSNEESIGILEIHRLRECKSFAQGNSLVNGAADIQLRSHQLQVCVQRRQESGNIGIYHLSVSTDK